MRSSIAARCWAADQGRIQAPLAGVVGVAAAGVVVAVVEDVEVPEALSLVPLSLVPESLLPESLALSPAEASSFFTGAAEVEPPPLKSVTYQPEPFS
jgi:hypothetical protein